MKSGRFHLPSLLASLALLIAAAVPAVAPGPQARQDSGAAASRFARVTTDSAQVRNLADVNGVVIATPANGSLVSVHGETAGWYEVEIPGGYAVWVFGRYLRPLEDAGVFEITRNGVNIRPAPKSDILSYPLPQALHAGDRVRVIEFLDPEAETTATWARIWSPPGVRGFVRAADTTPLGPNEQGSELWQNAMVALADHVPPPYTRPAAPRGTTESPTGTTGGAGTATEASAPKNAVLAKAEETARAELEAIRVLLEEEAGKPTPDFQTARQRLDAVLSSSPSGAVTAETRHEFERVTAFEAVARMRAELERERLRRAEEARRRQVAVWEASVAKDPLGHVFLSRGILLRQIGADGTPRYFLRFGQEITSELVCVSGRYDLDVFAGYEIGVQGESLQLAGAAGAPQAIEVQRLEILRRR